MSTSTHLDLNQAPAQASAPGAKAASLLICLPSMAADALEATLLAVADAFPAESVLVASPEFDSATASEGIPGIEPIAYPVSGLGYRSNSGWVLTATDYAAAAAVATGHELEAVLLIGNASPATSNLLRSLAGSVRAKAGDLAVPRFSLPPSDGLVNSAILYPLSRTLFGADIRFPLPVDAALSPRLLQRLAATAARHASLNQAALNQAGALMWPVAEAALAGFNVHDVSVGSQPQPRPTDADFNSIFSAVTSSLFSDIEAKAPFWQRSRGAVVPSPALPLHPAQSSGPSTEVQSMIESFRLAHANLQEIWSLVLAPQSRLALKKLSLMPADTFDLPADLWARTVYDFVLAFHARTLNRGHLLGAMAPLYLAWAASHLRAVNDDEAVAAYRIDLTASAFEREKSYLVSRWRWPDRFNP